MADVRTSVPGSGYGNIYVDTLVWGGMAWDPASGPIKVYFGQGADFEAAKAVHGPSEILLSGANAANWTADEKDAFSYATYVFSRVCGLTFELAENAAEADIVWWKTTLEGDTLGVHELPSDTQSWGYFNPASPSWANMVFGGDALNTILHEIGHGLGLAHPHDGGDQPDASLFPGVTEANPTGDHGLNQGIWTVMSYNAGWDKAPYDLSFGAQAGLGAFDIAALQAL